MKSQCQGQIQKISPGGRLLFDGMLYASSVTGVTVQIRPQLVFSLLNVRHTAFNVNHIAMTASVIRRVFLQLPVTVVHTYDSRLSSIICGKWQ